MNKNNDLQSLEIKTSMNKIRSLIELVIGIWTILTVIFSFMLYIRNLYFFNSWGINIAFYSEENIIYKLIYFLGCACFLIFISIFLDAVINSTKLSDKEKKVKLLIGFLIYSFFFFILSINQFVEQGFTFYNALIQFTCSTIIFIMVVRQTKNKFFKKTIVKFINYLGIKTDIYNKFLDILGVIIAVLLSIIIIGVILTILKKDYRIIETDQPNECSVVLYSTKDYFVVSECEIDEKNNELAIYKGKIKKIDNEGVIANKRIFFKIEKK